MKIKKTKILRKQTLEQKIMIFIARAKRKNNYKIAELFI